MLVQPRLALWVDMHQILTPTMELHYIAHFDSWNMLCGLYSSKESNIFSYSAGSENVIFIHCFAPLLHLKHLFNDLYAIPPYMLKVFNNWAKTKGSQKIDLKKLVLGLKWPCILCVLQTDSLGGFQHLFCSNF